ncbi:hypothetical protein TREPR_2859 [Treponema primitia ZAS-2]|uniref:Uncharacterized protein n=1 Tax=Treponema primitia (strain ATCC BAA-887 / DSM 12427 / ZAS-2) TaxID=545694 RepID=F5YPT6_TREPZ|nr:hypothetical protein TREPR_2859 [Treponema primitia ZAS-2]
MSSSWMTAIYDGPGFMKKRGLHKIFFLYTIEIDFGRN